MNTGFRRRMGWFILIGMALVAHGTGCEDEDANLRMTVMTSDWSDVAEVSPPSPQTLTPATGDDYDSPAEVTFGGMPDNDVLGTSFSISSPTRTRSRG